MLRSFLLIIISFLYAVTANANKVDSLLNSTINIQKPYIIITLPENDCINCKSNAFNLFNNFCKKKIIILSDSKLMYSYLKRNSNIDSSIIFLYHRQLSQYLSYKGLSSVCLVTKNGIKKYALDANFQNDVAHIRAIINKNCNSITDTALSDSSSILLGNVLNIQHKKPTFQCLDTLGIIESDICSYFNIGDNSYFFNKKFQMGAAHKNQDSYLTYQYLTFDSTLQDGLQSIVKKFSPRSGLLQPNDADSLLKKIGQPDITILATDSKSLLGYYNACFEDAASTEDHRFVKVYKQFFLFTNNTSHFDPFNLNSYTNKFWIPDTLYLINKLYELFPHRGYCLKGTDLYIPLIGYDTINGKLYFNYFFKIADFNLNPKGNAVLKRIIVINAVDTVTDFFMRIDKDGNPIVIDEGNQRIYFSKNNQTLQFKSIYKSLSYLYDLNFATKQQMNFAGVSSENGSKTPIIGIFDYKNKKTTNIIKLNNKTLLDKAQIANNTLRGYYKQANNIYFESIPFKL